MNKKAFSLSINFIVILIISIIVFSMGIFLVNKLFSFADEEKLRWDDMTQKEIEAALDSGDRVAIPRFKKTIGNGDFDTFGIGILNVLQGPDKDFNVSINFALASDKDGALICDNINPGPCGNPESWLRTTYDETEPITFKIPIKSNEKKDFLVGIKVDGAPKGTYVFNVDIKYDDVGTWREYDSLHKLYVNVP